MVWVGSGQVDQSEEVLPPTSENFWHPAESFPSDSFSVDYDKIIGNVNTLNVMAGEGSLRVETNQQKATLKVFTLDNWNGGELMNKLH